MTTHAEASQRRQLLAIGDGPPAALPAGCVHDLIGAQARRTPGTTAVVAGNAQLTYGELDRWCNQVAHRLIAAGVEPGALVGVCLERSFELVVALVAIWKAGGAYVPLDAEYPRERLALMVTDADLRVLVTDAAGAARLPRGEWRVVNPGSGGEPTDDPGRRVSPRDLAYVIYTSGSTGKPKGVMIEHRSVANHACWMAKRFGLTASDAILQKTSASFDASVCEFSAPLVSGGRVVLAPPGSEGDHETIVALCRRHGITLIQFVPSMLALFAEAEDLEELSSLRHLIAGGEALPAALAAQVRQRLPRCAVHNLYGPSEATIDTTAHRCTDEDRDTVPIGRAIAGARLRVLDDALEPVTIGMPGELWVGGTGLARGYLHRPELTAERFIADPFDSDPEARLYRTGDLVQWRADGELTFLGRSDEQVKLRGFRIELGEIAAVLLEHEAVAGAVVVLRHDEGDQPQLVAYVVARTGRTPTPAQLRSRLAERLPGHMVPAAYVNLAAMPLTGNGKLDRRALPAPSARDAASTANYVPPRDGLERELVELWQQLLGVAPVGVLDDFFALGGSSLVATRLVSRLRGTHTPRLTVRHLFEHPTVAGQARRLRALLVSG